MKSIIIFMVLILGICTIISPAVWSKESSTGQNADDSFKIGNVFFAQGKLQEAIQAYDEAIEKNPQHAGARPTKLLLLTKWVISRRLS